MSSFGHNACARRPIQRFARLRGGGRGGAAGGRKPGPGTPRVSPGRPGRAGWGQHESADRPHRGFFPGGVLAVSGRHRRSPGREPGEKGPGAPVRALLIFRGGRGTGRFGLVRNWSARSAGRAGGVAQVKPGLAGPRQRPRFVSGTSLPSGASTLRSLPMRILIRDDEPAVRGMTRLVVEAVGHTADEAPHALRRAPSIFSRGRLRPTRFARSWRKLGRPAPLRAGSGCWKTNGPSSRCRRTSPRPSPEPGTRSGSRSKRACRRRTGPFRARAARAKHLAPENHRRSAWRNGAFVFVSCPALVRALLEGERSAP